tara:strand:+ start:2493 stop:2777 length:285 start_codon:yes stop_codon:yes gene_type:complete
MPLQDHIEVEDQVLKVTDTFGKLMCSLFDEDPGLFEGRSTKPEWLAQVEKARIELEDRINSAIEEVEILLHDGQYHKDESFLRNTQKTYSSGMQ